MFGFGVITVLSLASLIVGHGFMTYPPIRLKPGDAENGYTYARSANREACQNLTRSANVGKFQAGSTMTIQYSITAAHQGYCEINLNIEGDEKFPCGQVEETKNVAFRLPNVTSTHAVLQWRYVTRNYSGELFHSCSDIEISKSASNGTNVDPKLPIVGSKCETVGSFRCRPDVDPYSYDQCSSFGWVTKQCFNKTKCLSLKDTIACV
ncbi:hypothetical protein O9G_006237, partial [Rozella allomycis CSF55]